MSTCVPLSESLLYRPNNWVQLWYTSQHRTVQLIVFPSHPPDKMLSTEADGPEGGYGKSCIINTNIIILEMAFVTPRHAVTRSRAEREAAQSN